MEKEKLLLRLKKRTAFICTLEILISFLLIAFTLVISKSAVADETLKAVDNHALNVLIGMDSLDVGSVVSDINEIKDGRNESIQESRSIEESIEESIRRESILKEESILQEEYDSSVAESSSIAESIAVNEPLKGTHITAGKVSYDLDDSDIPMLRRLFSQCIIIGNSRAKNAVDCGILTENEVRFQSGTPVDVITPFAVQCAYLYKPKTLFILGLNDVAHYDKDANKFKEDYISMIRQYLSVNPSSEIYCLESLPLPPEAISYFYRASFALPDFNKAIESMCLENGWHYVSASDYADPKYINSEDHAHYGKEFYFLFCQKMAMDMHLYEDLADLSYDISWDGNETDEKDADSDVKETLMPLDEVEHATETEKPSETETIVETETETSAVESTTEIIESTVESITEETSENPPLESEIPSENVEETKVE